MSTQQKKHTFRESEVLKDRRSKYYEKLQDCCRRNRLCWSVNCHTSFPVTAVDIVPEKVEMINNRKSPIQDDYIEKYLAEKDLNLTATLDAKAAYSDCCFHIFFIPFTNNVLLPQISFFTSQPTRMERCLLLTS